MEGRGGEEREERRGETGNLPPLNPFQGRPLYESNKKWYEERRGEGRGGEEERRRGGKRRGEERRGEERRGEERRATYLPSPPFRMPILQIRSEVV